MFASLKKFIARFIPLWNIPGDNLALPTSPQQVMLEKFIATLQEIQIIISHPGVQSKLLKRVPDMKVKFFERAMDLDAFNLAEALESHLVPPMDLYAETLAMNLSSVRAFGSEICLSPEGRALLKEALQENYCTTVTPEQDSEWVTFEILNESLKLSFRFFTGLLEELPDRSFDELNWAATTV